MFHSSGPKPVLASLGAVLLALVIAGSPTPAAGDAQHRVSRGVGAGECAFDPASLPHTADAIEGWYLSCRARC